MENMFQYIMKNFELYYKLENVKVSYGRADEDAMVIISQHADNTFFSSKCELDFKQIVWKDWKGVSIPFCFDNDASKEIISQQNNQVTINYDIIASGFYFLSGWNEYISSSKDDLGRVAFEFSAIKALKIPTLPVVNYYFDILYEALLKVKGVKKKKTWGDYSFGVTLTHDIDTCQSAWTEGSFSEFKKRRYSSIPGLILRHMLGKDDWLNFQRISAIDKQFGNSSTFFFLPRKGKAGQLKNADYNVTSERMQRSIRSLISLGHEIGVHGSFGTHISTAGLKEDILRINNGSIIGNRFHYLMFDQEKTVQVLEESGIQYDTSIGFADHIGFRRAFCCPFYLYDFINNRCSEVLEIPLIVMDASLHYSKYMGITQGEALEKVIGLIEEIRKHQGVFTILWHNTFFSDFKYTGWRAIYTEILKYCKENNALITNGREIYTRITDK